MIKKYSFHKILLLFIISIILFLTSKPVIAGDIWRRESETDKKQILLLQQVRVKTASNSELLNVAIQKSFDNQSTYELINLALDELVTRDYRDAIPVLESRATTVSVWGYSNICDLYKTIVKLDVTSDYNHKNDVHRLSMLIEYYKKYYPIGDEYRYQSPFTEGLKSSRLIRYYGAKYLLPSITENLEKQQKYDELIGVFNNYINNQDKEIHQMANGWISYLSSKITERNQPVKQKENIQIVFHQVKSNTLLAIISTARTQIQAGDYTLGESAIIATSILTERKALSEAEKSKLIEIFSSKKQNK